MTDDEGSAAGEGAATTDGRRSAVWRWGTPIVGVLIGALFVASAVSSAGIDLRPQRYQDLAGLAEAETEQYDRLEARLNRLTAEVDALTEDVDDRGVDRLRGQAEELQDPAGLTPRSGPGITVTMYDAPEELLQAARDSDDESHPATWRYIVHQQDIQAVVNAMWNAGATAVTIAGQRVVSTTGIRCRGAVVQLQGRPYPQPYEISAIGNPDALRAAVRSDERVQSYRADAADPLIEIGWELTEEERIEAPAYTGLIAHEYAEPLA